MIAAGKVFVPLVPVPCAQVEPEAFFHPDGERGDQRMDRQIRAARICAPCPVAAACLRWSLDQRIEYGIWGGMGEQDRRRMWRSERNHSPTPAGGCAVRRAPVATR